MSRQISCYLLQGLGGGICSEALFWPQQNHGKTAKLKHTISKLSKFKHCNKSLVAL